MQIRICAKNEEELHVYFIDCGDGVRKYVFSLRYSPSIPLRDQQHNQFSNEPLVVS